MSRVFFFLLVFILSAGNVKCQVPGNVSFKEDFSNNDRNWHVEYANNKSTFLENEAYTEEGYDKKAVCYTTQLIQLDPSKDFKISVYTKHLAGDMSQGYGFSFGPDRKDGTYYFTIAADGRFTVTLGPKKIIDWSISDAIHPRHNENKIAVVREGTKCWLYVNDQKITSFMLDNFKTGELFFIGLYTKGKQKVAYDDVMVSGYR